MQVLGINRTDDAGTAQAFERQFSVPYPSLADTDGTAIAALQGTVPVNAVPTTIVLDRSGKVAGRILGLADPSTLRSMVDGLLGRARRPRHDASRTPATPSARTVISGSLLLAIPVALVAGLVSFASPCVLPLVPAYVGYLGGMTGTAHRVARRRATRSSARPRRARRVLLGVALFVAGFTAVFVALAVLAGSLGGLLVEYQDPITRVLGVVVIVLGLGFLGLIPFLQNEKRVHLAPRAGLWGAPLLGVTFGLGWVPCIGPTLAAILTLSLDGGSAGRGALLAVAFCLGLGLPFLLVALFVDRSAGALGFLRRHRLAIMRFGGGDARGPRHRAGHGRVGDLVVRGCRASSSAATRSCRL